MSGAVFVSYSTRRWRTRSGWSSGRTMSFSPSLHSVFGRQYRVVEIDNNVPKEVGTVTATVVPHI